MTNLQSHFSCTTVDSEPCTDSYICDDTSRFSDWTDAPTRLSPQSTCTLSILDSEPISPPAELALNFPTDTSSTMDDKAEHRQDQGRAPEENGLPSALSFSTVSSAASSAAPSSRADPDSATSEHFSWSKFQHYSLPAEDTGSGTTIKPAATVEHVTPLMVEDEHCPQVAVCPDPAIAHSTSMQKLLDELSYLGGIIQQQ